MRSANARKELHPPLNPIVKKRSVERTAPTSHLTDYCAVRGKGNLWAVDTSLAPTTTLLLRLLHSREKRRREERSNLEAKERNRLLTGKCEF